MDATRRYALRDHRTHHLQPMALLGGRVRVRRQQGDHVVLHCRIACLGRMQSVAQQALIVRIRIGEVDGEQRRAVIGSRQRGPLRRFRFRLWRGGERCLIDQLAARQQQYLPA